MSEGCPSAIWLDRAVREESVRHARTPPWYGVQARGAVKDEAHANVKGKELKLCDADCFGLAAGSALSISP